MNLRKARLQAGLSRTALAMRLNVGRQNIYHWENGKRYPNRENRVKLRKAFKDLGIEFEVD